MEIMVIEQTLILCFRLKYPFGSIFNQLVLDNVSISLWPKSAYATINDLSWPNLHNKSILDQHTSAKNFFKHQQPSLG